MNSDPIKRTIQLKKRTLSNNKEIWYFIDSGIIKEIGSEEVCRAKYNDTVNGIKNAKINTPRIISDEIIEQYEQ